MTTTQLTRLAQFGTLWRPATAAYGSPPGLYVNCDRCKTTHLPACVHLGTTDLCLPCAHTLLVDCKEPASPPAKLIRLRPASASSGSGSGRRFA
jgi:hypothetical protein